MYWKRSRAKIINGALPGGDGVLACTNERVNEIVVTESREIARVAYLDQITSVGSGRARKL